MATSTNSTTTVVPAPIVHEVTNTINNAENVVWGEVLAAAKSVGAFIGMAGLYFGDFTTKLNTTDKAAFFASLSAIVLGYIVKKVK